MSKLTVGVMLLLFGGLLFGQQAKKAPHNQPPLLISQYMREVGLDYLEGVEKMQDEAFDGFKAYIHDPVDTKLWIEVDDSPYGKRLHTLETHIEINLRTEGDKQFLSFLQRTKAAGWGAYEDAMQLLDPKHGAWPRHPELKALYAPCLVHAQYIIKDKYFTEGDCSEAMFGQAEEADERGRAARKDAAAKNAAAGVFVNQVRTGMSFAEVESALGVPQIRIDLGEKILYKYNGKTVEFHDGKVTDVR